MNKIVERKTFHCQDETFLDNLITKLQKFRDSIQYKSDQIIVDDDVDFEVIITRPETPEEELERKERIRNMNKIKEAIEIKRLKELLIKYPDYEKHMGSS